MGNTFITPTVVAKVGIAAFENWLCMANLVHRDYSTEFRSIGDSLRIRKPSTLSTVEFDGDLTGEYQTITESYTDVDMDTIITVPVEVTQKELTLDIVSFRQQVIDPAMRAMAQNVDYRLLGLYKDVPYFQATSGTTAISDFTAARKVLVDNQIPMGDPLNAVLSPLTSASVLNIDTFHEADKAGTSEGLRAARIGRVMGFDTWENQNVRTHTIGTTDLAAAIDNGAGYSEGDTTIHIDALGTGTINEGTIITIADNTGQYVVTEDSTISGNECDIKIYPGLNADVTDGDVVTIAPAATTSKENLMFHRNAFTMVTAPLAPPIGGALGATESYRGLNLNVVYDFDSNKLKNKIIFSMLCGFKTLTPELACRFRDAS